MNYLQLLTIVLAFTFIAQNVAAIEDKPFVVVTPSYNNERWYESNLNSILNQDYDNYRILYIDDCSSDQTALLVENYLVEHHVDYRVVCFDEMQYASIPETVDGFANLVNQEKRHFTLIKNKKRAGALANLYRAIHSCQDEEIIATVDGDDWLAHPQVIKNLNETYQGEVWFTHGCLKEYPYGHVAWSIPLPKDKIKNNDLRNYRCPSHLRTFYTWLFKKIALEDFLYEGQFFPMAWDMAIMYPLAEMAGERHAFISEVNYIYNMENQINDNKVNPTLQNQLDYIIRNKKPYQRLPLEILN